MIELFDTDRFEIGRASSQGNQLKWKAGDYWYKADSTGYEGLAEYVISHMLTYSDLEKEEYVLYGLETIRYKNKVMNGCKSQNFLNDGEMLITLERLYHNHTGRSFYSDVYLIKDHVERLKYIVDRTEEMSGIKDFGIYMSKILTIDTVFLNEDRHLHNIAVIRKRNGDYRLCPVFDCGAGLLSDTGMDYPPDTDIYEAMRNEVKAKTFTEDLDEQLEIAEKLYGSHIHINAGRKEAEAIITAAEMYDEAIRKRVIDIVVSRIAKFGYLFC